MLKFKWLCSGNQNDHYFNLIKSLKNHKNQTLQDFVAEKIDIDFFVNMPKEEDVYNLNLNYKNLSESTILRKIVKYSDVVFFYYNNQFIEWILNLPQLRHDMLNLYRINPQDYTEDEETAEEKINFDNIQNGYVKYSDYLELLTYALNIQLNKVDKEVNFFKLIDKINFKMFVSGAR